MASSREPDRSALELFAEELRAVREQAGVSRDDLAAKINYSASLVAMVEGLRSVPQADFAQRCDEALGTPGTFAGQQKRLRNLTFPASFRPFAGYEARATSLRWFEHSLVPGLLQTEDYARGPGHPPEHPRGRSKNCYPPGYNDRRSWSATARRWFGQSSMNPS
jgi:transcriptional regulator with XRE-family HTH domain